MITLWALKIDGKLGGTFPRRDDARKIERRIKEAWDGLDSGTLPDLDVVRMGEVVVGREV